MGRPAGNARAPPGGGAAPPDPPRLCRCAGECRSPFERPFRDARRARSDRRSWAACLGRHRGADDHAIAVEASAKEFIGRAPEIEAEAPVVEIAEALDHGLAVDVEVARPLLEGKEVAVEIGRASCREREKIWEVIESSNIKDDVDTIDEQR